MAAFFHHFQNWLGGRTPLFPDPSVLLELAVLLITGFAFARLARRFRLPVVTGQILGGIVLGHYVLRVFPDSGYAAFAPITDFALGLIGFSIGSHLDFRRLHNAGRRIFWIALTDMVVTPVLVYAGLRYLAGVSLEVSLVCAAIAIATSPGSTLHVVREKRARGPLTQTLLGVVALNNVLAIFAFYLVYCFILYPGGAGAFGSMQTMGRGLLLFAASLGIGSLIAAGVIFFTERRQTSISFLSVVFLSVVLSVGMSEALHLSGVLSSLVLGMLLANASRNREQLFSAFGALEDEIFGLFFILAGTHVNFHAIQTASLAGLLYIGIRFLGKFGAPFLGAVLGGAPKKLARQMAWVLHPTGGVAIGLVLLCERTKNLDEVAGTITAIVLSAVVVNEIFGPILTGLTIRRAGEQDQNRLRLMEFIQEEYILTNLHAADKWEALDQLATFLYQSHDCRNMPLAELKRSVMEREREISTGIGDGLAIPHAIIEQGPRIQGVIGVAPDGIDFEALDDEPVYIFFLVATPADNYQLHLHVLANIAKIFGHHPHIRDQIVKAKSAAEVFAILQAEEIQELNPFFDEWTEGEKFA